MIRKNVYTAQKQPVVAHDGEGRISFVRPFDDADFESSLSFVDYVEIPPGASIGLHTHGENEEVYFIVEGQGRMTTNEESYEVKGGDLVINRRGWRHGLANNSGADLRVLVWEVAYVAPGE